MKSWDVFDTLIARRISDGHDIPQLSRRMGIPEIELERELCFPIQENIRQVRPGDLLISDMHLPAEQLSALIREITGLDNRLIVTQDGKRTGVVWTELERQGRPELHTGDDPIADVLRPGAARIPTSQYLGARHTEGEMAIGRAGFPRLARAMREARLRSFGEHRDLELAQIELNFPALYLGALALRPHLAGRRVLASSRDCFLWLPLLRDVAKCFAVYWFSSRLARAFPSASFLNYTAGLADQSTILLDLCGTGWSLLLFAEEFGMPLGGIWLLAHCAGPLNADYDSLRQRRGEVRWIFESCSQALEHNNLAPHPMVRDYRDGAPDFYNPTDFDWQGSPEIRAQHSAFRLALDALARYPQDPSEPAPAPDLIASLIAQLPELPFFPREDRYVQEQLRRKAYVLR